MQRLMGEDENNFNDRMMNNKSTVMERHIIPDEKYLGKNYHIVIGFVSILLMAYFLMFLQQRYQLLSRIVKIFKSLCHTKADPPNIQNDLQTTQRLMGEDENICNDACILFVFCVVLILKKQKQQIYQSLSYIARLIDLNIQVPTMYRLMGEDENNFNETDETMIKDGDGVGMSNCGFRQDNQIPNATQDTPKLCISGSRWQ